MGTRVAYPIEVKDEVIELKLSGMTIKEIMIELNIKNKTQIETFYLDRLNNELTSIIIQRVIDYINYYNKIRIQQKLGYKCSIEYRNL